MDEFTKTVNGIIMNYVYTNLREASGTANVIAVVKYYRSPIKTKGTGYSVFATLTDPSLQGGKLPCTFFDDVLEKLPQILEMGDIVVLHRLTIKQFAGKNHGYGYGTTGFAVAVFSSVVDSPLEPRTSLSKCSYGDLELQRVGELRKWYNSPAYPVERETTLAALPPPIDPETGTEAITRIWDFKHDTFATTEGQVVALYSYPDDERCTILYLWDGSPPHSVVKPTFVRPSRDHRVRLLETVRLDPILAVRTGHECDDLDDLTVPIYIYDEHSAMTKSIQPGDLVRVSNVHVLRCRAFDCPVPNCQRLIVHGGGYKFRRGLEVLAQQRFVQFVLLNQSSLETTTTLPQPTQDAATFPLTLSRVEEHSQLMSNIRHAFQEKPVYLKMIANGPKIPQTIAQICKIPLAIHRSLVESGVPQPPTTDPSSNGWMRLEEDPDEPCKYAVVIRLVARVIAVAPCTLTEWNDTQLVTCSRCATVTRLSMLQSSNEDFCSCSLSSQQKRRRTTESSDYTNPDQSISPMIFLQLKDSTGELIVCVSGETAVRLISGPQLLDPIAIKQQWAKFFEASSKSTHESLCTTYLTNLSQLVNKSVDLIVRVSWGPDLSTNLPGSLDELRVLVHAESNSHFSWPETI